jgi:hypothetical protein
VERASESVSETEESYSENDCAACQIFSFSFHHGFGHRGSEGRQAFLQVSRWGMTVSYREESKVSEFLQQRQGLQTVSVTSVRRWSNTTATPNKSTTTTSTSTTGKRLRGVAWERKDSWKETACRDERECVCASSESAREKGYKTPQHNTQQERNRRFVMRV